MGQRKRQVMNNTIFEPNSYIYDSNAKKNAQKFYVISSIPRSGSSFLSKALWDTNLAGFPHEYLHAEKHMKILMKRWGIDNFYEYIKVLKSKRATPNKVCGLKSHYYQFEILLAERDIKKLLPGLQYIYITRKDHFRQAVSFARARQTKKWSYQEAALPKETFDINLINNSFKWIETEEQRWEEYFLNSGITPYRVVYEEFCEQYEETILDIINFLNIRIPIGFKINPSQMRKQADQLTEEWVHRYLSLKSSSISASSIDKQNDNNELSQQSFFIEKQSDQIFAGFNNVDNRPNIQTQKTYNYRNKPPKISVIIISYNFERYLRECIESILNQTLRPFEIIICDDCSTDNSWAIISEYARQYPELIKSYRHERNIGMQRNLSFSLKKDEGDLISVIDGDDRWLPRKLELEWKALQKHPDARIAYSNVYTTDADGNRTGIWYAGKGPAPPSGDVFVKVFSKRFFPNNRSVFRNELVYRSALEAIGSYDEDIKIHVDWDLKVRLTARFPVVYSGEALVEYRSHDGGISHSPPEKLYRSVLSVYEKNMPLLTSRTKEEAIVIRSNVENLLDTLSDRCGETVKREHVTSMKALKKDRQLRRLPCFVVNSLPKAGTNLLAKVVNMFPGIQQSKVHFGHSTFDQFKDIDANNDILIPVGVDFPQQISLSVIQELFQELKNGQFVTAHIPYSSKLALLLHELGIKMLLILRDPRDVVVSHAKYVASQPDHPLYELYQPLSEPDRIMTSIVGTKELSPDGPALLNIYERSKSVLPWVSKPFTYTTYFEKIVGPKGGGSRKFQLEEIQKIAHHLGIQFSVQNVEKIAEQVFGGTPTFRKGEVGSWRDYFTEEHRRVFHKLAGQILVDIGYEQDDKWVDCQNDKTSITILNADKKREENDQLSDNIGENLIFLISQPRAGSTLLQRILAGHLEIHTMAEPWIMLHPLYALKQEGIAAEYESSLSRQGLDDFLMQVPEGEELYIKALREMAAVLYNRTLKLSGKSFFLDKTPRYYFIIPELYRVFPKAKFIFLLRNPMAVLSSVLSTWCGNQIQALVKSPNHIIDMTKGPHYLIEGIKKLKEDAIVVHYEELVRKPKEVTQHVCNRIGIPFYENILEYGQHPAPKGRFGDSVGVHKHNRPVSDYIDKWAENLAAPNLIEFASQYLSSLGSDVFSNLGYSYQEIKDKLESQRLLNGQEIPQKRIKESSVLNRQGEELFSKGDIEGALSAFTKAIEINPKFASAHNNLGVLYWQTGEAQKAVEHFTKALEIDPDDRDMILNCGGVFKVLGKLEDAKKFYSSYLQTHPDDGEMSELLKALDEDRQTYGKSSTCMDNDAINAAGKDLRQARQIFCGNSKKDTLKDPANWPRISIVTPSFNQGQFLEECIDSILSQNYPNLEYIIMDGGSTDNSVDIIKKYETYLTYWQSKPDGGQYAAISEGFKKTTGEIMTWLNSDDKFHPNAFRIVASIFMHRKDVDWIMGRPNVFNEQGQQTWIEKFLPLWSREKYLKKEYKFIQQEGTFWRRSLWVKSGATLNTDWDLAGDLELWVRFFRYAQLYNIDALIAGYRYHSGQKAQLFRDKYIREAEKILDREILLFKEGTNKELLPVPKPILISEIRKFVSKSDFEGALDAFAKGIEIIPNSAGVTHNNLGVLYWQAGEAQKAVDHFVKAMEIDPNHRDTILNCGELFKSLEKIEDARNIYASYLQKNPGDEEIAKALEDLQDKGTIEIKGVKDEKYLVSAIVSTYNSERFIRGCLEDLEAQTIDDRLEIIVVNSGSEQNEDAIVKEFQQRYKNIKYVKTKERETVYQAWNRGTKAASGKYITNANTDDRHREDAFERMAEVLDARADIVLVYADVIITEHENETFDRCTPAGSYRWLDWDRRYLLEGRCFMGPQPMWRRSSHDEYGYFDDTLVTSGDYEFWLRVSQTNNFYHIPDFLGLYLRSPNSIESSNLEIQKTENEKILRMYREADASGDMIRRFYSDNDEELIRIHNQRGEELFNAGKFKSAKIIFEQILSKNPNLIEPLNNLGTIAFQQGGIDQAISYFTRVLETDKNYFEAIENLGKCAEVQKDYLKAAEWFKRALKLKPEEISLLNSLGNCFIQTEDLLKARGVYEKSLGLDGGQENIKVILRELKRMKG